MKSTGQNEDPIKDATFVLSILSILAAVMLAQVGDPFFFILFLSGVIFLAIHDLIDKCFD